eukprot:TRINITY_DN15688_c0_g1_i1.p1 TRINITY_DN15688_c0_g1~~TRINITY_DN15688_c0_g1_i1.p1  ORF type:complete len:422 (-),score=37.03 TRINITY_DN15688_c0_g1_i1:295-1560(-)
MRIGMRVFGDGMLHSDPSWYGSPFRSSYLRYTHRHWHERCRNFLEECILQSFSGLELAEILCKEINRQCYQRGLLPCLVGATSGAYDWVPVKGPHEFNYFHELVFIDELSRCASGGLLRGIEGVQLAVPSIVNFGSEEMKSRVVPSCLKGEKTICCGTIDLGGTNDVANIKVTARRDANHYVVNGSKGITNGLFGDYIAVAVRTGPPRVGGISMLLLESTMPGVSTKRMDCQGVWAIGETLVICNNVKVPVSNLIGQENRGLEVIRGDFNHARWIFLVRSNCFSRCLLEQSLNYARKRSTFGKKLIDQPLIFRKLTDMTQQVEATQHRLEKLTLQMCELPTDQAMSVLDAPLGLAAALSVKVLADCDHVARQIFGGDASMRSGHGDRNESSYQDKGIYEISETSDEIFLDLGVCFTNRSRL